MSCPWVSYGELVDLAGEDGAMALCKACGGLPFFISKLPKEDDYLEKTVGVRGADALRQVYGGEYITFPNRRGRAPRKGEALDLLDAGMSPREVALKLDLTLRYVFYLAKHNRRRVRQASLLSILS